MGVPTAGSALGTPARLGRAPASLRVDDVTGGFRALRPSTVEREDRAIGISQLRRRERRCRNEVGGWSHCNRHAVGPLAGGQWAQRRSGAPDVGKDLRIAALQCLRIESHRSSGIPAIGAPDVRAVRGDGNHGEDPDDCHRDHEFDQRKAIFHGGNPYDPG